MTQSDKAFAVGQGRVGPWNPKARQKAEQRDFFPKTNSFSGHISGSKFSFFSYLPWS